jgi:hypothetical protein
MQFPSQNVSFDESSMSSSMHSSKLGANNNSRFKFFAFSILNPYFAFPPSTIFCGFAFPCGFAFAAAGLFSFDDADFFLLAVVAFFLRAGAGFVLAVVAFFLRAGAGFVLAVVAFFLRAGAGAGLPLCKGSSSSSSSELLPSSLLDRADVPGRGAGRLSLPSWPMTGVSRLVGST